MNARPRSPFGVWLAQVVCLAAAVYIVGRLGRALIVPSGELVSVWTASGVALAALLFFGNRIWPGAWLGSFLLEMV
jgi:integral membrane sensor domain MASE1